MSSPPPLPAAIDKNGFLCADSADLDELLGFDAWHRTACPHPNQRLIFRTLGNIAGIGLVRQAVEQLPHPLPVLSESVVHSGSHSGDWLAFERVSLLQAELDELERNLPQLDLSPDDRAYIQGFVKDLRDVCTAAQTVKKPIAF